MSLTVAVVIALAWSSTASASHHFGNYGTYGYHWFARYYNGPANRGISVVSNDCSRTIRETGAWVRVRDSTGGTPEFDSQWPYGIWMGTWDCEIPVNITHDISIVYSDWDVTHPGATWAGENHGVLAPQTYCSMYDAPYKCGRHPSKVHINEDIWVTKGANWQERLLMHETGHSFGLAHHCSANSIMNDGTAGCNGGAWLNVMEYLATDRNGVVNIYPNWIYP